MWVDVGDETNIKREDSAYLLLISLVQQGEGGNCNVQHTSIQMKNNYVLLTGKIP